jgi:hypothetical protein
MISKSPRINCPLLEQKVTVTRCTDLLLERFDVMPDTTLTDLQGRRRLSRTQLDDLCRSCPYNPVEDRLSGERALSAAGPRPAAG